METEFLYHYTSIQTLVLILKYKKIRFNNLLNVDDPEEVESKDLGKIGKCCLVSCWTNNSADSLPMWNMYTPDMKGIRIKMRKYPFKKYKYNKGEFYIDENIESYINYRDECFADVTSLLKCPLLKRVEYTDDESVLKDTILNRTVDKISLNISKIGTNKHTCWSFQDEYRYLIYIIPGSFSELEKFGLNEIMLRYISFDEDRVLSELYLDLAENAFEGMEILIGPKATDAEFIIIESLLEKYCNSNIKIEKSRIKVR